MLNGIATGLRIILWTDTRVLRRQMSLRSHLRPGWLLAHKNFNKQQWNFPDVEIEVAHSTANESFRFLMHDFWLLARWLRCRTWISRRIQNNMWYYIGLVGIINGHTRFSYDICLFIEVKTPKYTFPRYCTTLVLSWQH